MKNKGYLYLSAILLLFSGSSIFAQDMELMYEPHFSVAKARVPVNATIVKTYEANLGTELKFGSVVPESKPKKVEITIDGRRRVSIEGRDEHNRNIKNPEKVFGDDISENSEPLTEQEINNPNPVKVNKGGPKPVVVADRTVNGKRQQVPNIVVSKRGYSPARYYVSGDDVSCNIMLPQESIVLSNATNTANVTVSDWDARVYSDNGGASQSLIMGATLSVGSKEKTPPGVYEGSYSITFLYN